MTEEGGPRGLDLVYSATDPAELAKAYAVWAAEYDRETVVLGYCLPFAILGWVGRYAAPGAKLLDVGCGTGLSGPLLAAMGYDDVTGLDLSPDMLKLAAGRNSYGALVQAELGRDLPLPSGTFDLCLSSGVFTAGHAPASGFDEILRATKPDGHVVATIRETLVEAEFRPEFARLRDAGACEIVEESRPFRAFVLDEEDVLVRTFVLCRTASSIS